MKIKVAEATNDQLDRLVARCEGWTNKRCGATCNCLQHIAPNGWASTLPKYTTDWNQGGPIIDRENLELIYYGTEGYQGPWESQKGCDTHYIDQSPGDAMAGPTALVAAMRAHVKHKLGDEVEVPEELEWLRGDDEPTRIKRAKEVKK